MGGKGGKGAINVEVVSETSKSKEKKLTPKGKVADDRPQLGNGKA